MRAPSAILVAAALLLPACGGDDTAATTTEPGTVAAPTATSTTTTTTSAPATTTTTTTVRPPAAGSLGRFLAAARDLDTEIRAAADLFNAGFDPDTGALSDEARTAIAALTGKPGIAAQLVPAGLSVDLETAALAVYADLNSRVHALRGAEARLPQEPAEDVGSEYAMECLRNGSVSAARFDDDLAAADRLAGGAPIPTASPDSDEAGVLAVRIEAIDLMNSGCDACGGVEYDEPIPVDWAGRFLADGVGFTATFENDRWVIEIMAC